jgi:cell division inhibitor SepF
MAGAMRKMAVYLGLVEDEDRRYDEDDYNGYESDSYDDYGEAPPRDARQRETSLREAREPGYAREAREDGGRVMTALREERSASVATMPARGLAAALATGPDLSGHDYRITALHPRTYNEARTIGEHFRDGVPVIMNLSEMEDVDAKRLVDFAAGLIFGLRGSIERVTSKVFLLSPPNVNVTAEDKERIAGGFFNQS